MAPAFKYEDGFRFYIHSKEESRKHVHVWKAGRKAKIWLEPVIEVVWNRGFPDDELSRILKLVKKNENDFKAKYEKHYGKIKLS